MCLLISSQSNFKNFFTEFIIISMIIKLIISLNLMDFLSIEKQRKIYVTTISVFSIHNTIILLSQHCKNNLTMLIVIFIVSGN